MSQQIIELVESAYRKSKLPEFRVGDTIDVHQKIVEGNRTRTQIFNGVVIGRKGGGVSETFTVRRIVNNEGVERIFMLHSPRITKLEVKREGKTRRAKLYYLRDRVGKSRRLKELRRTRTQKSARQEGATTRVTTDAPEATPETAGV
jgi:large subunit ribosomal protein L19